MAFKTYIKAARLRTLPLSVSGIFVGAAVASSEGKFNGVIFLLALVTTILLQILSNFANDYGDGVKGTDNNRIGEQRMVASGEITYLAMKKWVLILALITFFSGLLLVWKALGFTPSFVLFVLLGVLSIIAAIKYTVGKSAYGYKAMGDIAVFLFFGVISTIGIYYLMCLDFRADLLLPASSIGLWSMAVLNLNNMRDIENDAINNKRTIAVILGRKKSKFYHFTLIILGFTCAVLFLINNAYEWYHYISVLAFVPLFLDLLKIFSINNPIEYDPHLKIVALSTFLFSLLFFISWSV